MPIEQDYSTFERLGNTGSVALPTALGLGLTESQFQKDTKIALLGIGSGLNSVMMGLEMGEIGVESQG
jgi:acyl-CoA:acyl-CoA alkyltransferase